MASSETCEIHNGTTVLKDSLKRRLSQSHEDERPSKEKSQRAINDKGVFDEVLAALKAHDHPFISVGLMASHWMGCRGWVDPIGIDILIRDHQLGSIADSILQSGIWIPAHAPKVGELDRGVQYDLIRDADVAFQLAGQGNRNVDILRLWSEETYHMKVDTEDVIEVPDIYCWVPFLIEEKYHPAANRTDDWWYGPITLSHSEGRNPIPHNLPRGKPQGHPSSIFIPTIPRYLEALVYQRTQFEENKRDSAFMASWQIDLLTRYLYLELPHQAVVIEFEVDGPTEIALVKEFRNYVRKPAFVLSWMGGHLRHVQIKRHDPETIPEDVRDGTYWARGEMAMEKGTQQKELPTTVLCKPLTPREYRRAKQLQSRVNPKRSRCIIQGETDL